jgi:ferrous iron transport protein B
MAAAGIVDTPSAVACVVLTGNPNCGKTTLFNALTGLRAKVGNYAGVTVERKEGRMLGSYRGNPVTVLDLPGTYSLSPQSLDEQISRDALFHRLRDVPPPSLVVVVVDASNLERNLYYATQVIELGYPTLLALNMIDVAAQNGHQIDAGRLALELGVPVFPMVASSGEGVQALRQAILELRGKELDGRLFCELRTAFKAEVEWLAAVLRADGAPRTAAASAEALLLISDERALAGNPSTYSDREKRAVFDARSRIEQAGEDWRSSAIEARYAKVGEICAECVQSDLAFQETFSDKLDRVLTHKIYGMLVFVLVMALMFQSIFTFARMPMEAIQAGVDWLGASVDTVIAPGGDLQ